MVHTVNHEGKARLLERGFEVLFALGRHPDGARLADLSRECDLSKATTLRILRTLIDLEAVSVDAASHVYRLGPAISRLNAAAAQPRDLVKAAMPVLERLRDDTRETVCLFRRQGAERVVIAAVPSLQDLRFSIEVGQRRLLSAGAPGRILMGQLPEQELAAVLKRVPADARRALLAECRQARTSGYAVSQGEVVVGGTAIAAPVVGFDGEVVALSVFGPSARLSRATLDKLVPVVRRAARELSHRMNPSGNGKEPEQ